MYISIFSLLFFFWSVCTILLLFFYFFFFKQKTAYEMRISDWSSDVCSSDLTHSLRCRQRLSCRATRQESPRVFRSHVRGVQVWCHLFAAELASRRTRDRRCPEGCGAHHPVRRR